MKLLRRVAPLSRRQAMAALTLCALGVRPSQAHEYYALLFTLIHPWTEPTLPGQNHARVHFRLENITGRDRLLGARFMYASSAELRSGQDDAAPAVPWIDIPPGERLDLLPDRQHVLLKGLTQPLQPDRSYPLELRFETSGVLYVMMSMSGVD